MEYATGTPWRDIRLGIKATEMTKENIPVMDSGLKTEHGNILFGLMQDSKATILIPANRDAPWPEPALGEKLELNEFWLGGVLHIALTCLSDNLEDVFWRLTIVLLERLQEGARADEAVETTIEEFRSLLQLPEQDKINHEKLLGLIGELVLLLELTKYNKQPCTCWKGPKGGRHDFVFNHATIEVKTGSVEDLPIVHISSVFQLENVNDCTLSLAHIRLRQSGNLSVASLSHDILNAMEEGQKGLFLDCLSQIGCQNPEAPEWNTATFDLAEIVFYRIENGFPRIIPHDLPGARVPEGVADLSYSIDLERAASFRISKNDAKNLLNTLFSGAN